MQLAGNLQRVQLIGLCFVSSITRIVTDRFDFSPITIINYVSTVKKKYLITRGRHFSLLRVTHKRRYPF